MFTKRSKFRRKKAIIPMDASAFNYKDAENYKKKNAPIQKSYFEKFIAWILIKIKMRNEVRI